MATGSEELNVPMPDAEIDATHQYPNKGDEMSLDSEEPDSAGSTNNTDEEGDNEDNEVDYKDGVEVSSEEEDEENEEGDEGNEDEDGHKEVKRRIDVDQLPRIIYAHKNRLIPNDPKSRSLESRITRAGSTSNPPAEFMSRIPAPNTEQPWYMSYKVLDKEYYLFHAFAEIVVRDSEKAQKFIEEHLEKEGKTMADILHRVSPGHSNYRSLVLSREDNAVFNPNWNPEHSHHADDDTSDDDETDQDDATDTDQEGEEEVENVEPKIDVAVSIRRAGWGKPVHIVPRLVQRKLNSAEPSPIAKKEAAEGSSAGIGIKNSTATNEQGGGMSDGSKGNDHSLVKKKHDRQDDHPEAEDDEDSRVKKARMTEYRESKAYDEDNSEDGSEKGRSIQEKSENESSPEEKIKDASNNDSNGKDSKDSKDGEDGKDNDHNGGSVTTRLFWHATVSQRPK